MGDGDAVTARKKQNAAHVDATVFHFVFHDTFELVGGQYGPASKYKSGIDLGPRTLLRSELLPVAPVGLQKAQQTDVVQQPLAIRQWLKDNRVNDRWLYAFSVEKGKPPKFRYEIRLDSKGIVSFLDAAKFAATRPAGDTQSDSEYLARAEWTNTGKPFFRQKLPLGKHNAPIKWHFFGTPLRLRSSSVDQLASNAKFLAPDPGYNHFAKGKATVERLELWEIGRLVPVEDGFIVRVFDPMAVVDNMRKDFQQKLDDFLRYSTPVGEGDRLDKTQRRLRVATIATHVELVLDRAVLNNLDLADEELKNANQLWTDLRKDCFTDPGEVKFLAGKEGPMETFRASEHFLRMEKIMREEYLARINRAVVKLLLLLSSEPWAFMERQFYVDDDVTDARAHEFLLVCAHALDRIGETDLGRHYLSLMMVGFEDGSDRKAMPNAFTLENFVLLDKPVSGFDTAKIAVKAGKTPFSLWSKLLSIVNAMSKDHLQTLFTNLSGTLTAEQTAALQAIPAQKHIFASTAFFMCNRLKQVYKVDVVNATIVLPDDTDKVFFFAKNAAGDEIKRPYVAAFNTPDSLADDLAKFDDDFFGPGKPKPKLPLTFDHINTAVGFIGLFFNMRELYVSATEKGALDTTKAAFAVFQSVYGLPFVAKKASEKIKNASLAKLSAGMAKWIRARGVAVIGFVTQAVTVAFAAADTWSKASAGQPEEITSSLLNLAAQTLLLISAGMVIASGGVATPAAAILAGIAAVIAVGQFVYDLFRPDEVEFGLRLSLFGKGFHEDTNNPEPSARKWMMCRSNDLRLFNPDFGNKPLERYETQIEAFSNLMHNYHVQVKFSDELGATGADIEIIPGLLPRDAYFEVKMDLTWWFRERNGIIFDSPGDTWSAPLSFKVFPFAKAAPPLAKGAPSTAAYEAMRTNGVVDPTGAPMSVGVDRQAAMIKLTFDAEAGEFSTWTGEIRNLIGGVATPVRIQIRHHAHYKLKGKVDTGPDGARRLRIRINFESDSSTHLGVTSVPVRVFYMSQPIDSGVPVEIFEDIVAVPAITVLPNGRERVDVEIPHRADTNTERFNLKGFQLRLIFRDKGSTGSERFESTPSPQLTPEQTLEKEEDLSFLSDLPQHFRLRYTATLLYPGDVATITVRPDQVFVRADDGSFRAVDGVDFTQLTMQYVRNEGTGEPFEEGSRPLNEIFEHMTRQADGSWKLVSRRPFNGGPIRLFDKLVVRFTAQVELEDGTRAFTEGPFQEDVKAHWSWADAKNPENFKATALIQEAKVQVRLVLDGDPTTKNFLPSDLARPSREAFLEALCDGNVFQKGWFPPNHRYENAPGIGTPNSDVEQAIDHCKT